MSEQLFDTSHLETTRGAIHELRLAHSASVAPDPAPTDDQPVVADLVRRSTQYKLDAATIRAGREGIRRARAALQQSRRSNPERLAA